MCVPGRYSHLTNCKFEETRLEELYFAAQSENWDQVRFLAHKLRGTGGGFGFQILTDFASKLGYQVHNGNAV